MTENEIHNKEKNRELQIKNIEYMSNLAKRISDDLIQKNKDGLFDIYRNLLLNKNTLKFENDNLEKYKDLILDIFKNKIYECEGSKIKFQEIEIDNIMNEAIEKNDFSLALHKFKEKEKNIFDYKLKKTLKRYIKNCENGITNTEIKEINKLCQREEFDEVIKKFQNLLNNENLFEMFYEEYLKILKYIIDRKLKKNKNNNNEFKLYKEFIINNKNRIKSYKKYFEQLKNFESNFYLIEEEKNDKIKKIDLIDEYTSNFQIKKEDVDNYLKEIEERIISESELKEFEKLKKYIYEQINNFNEEIKNNFINSKVWISDKNKYKNELNNIKNIGKIYSYLNQINKYNLYTIQLISLLILSQELPQEKKGIFCKINTGEGKSTIIQFFAAYKVLSGHKVDIISSTPDLATRDAKDEEKIQFYKKLNIEVGDVKEKSYKADIIFGDSTNFCADILLDEYEFCNQRKERIFDVVIIDEVDNMCIDNLASKTQLTKKFPGYQSLYTFYYTIILCFIFIAEKMKLVKEPIEIEKKRKIIKKAILGKLKDNPIILGNEFKDEFEVIEEVDKYLLQLKNSRNKNKNNDNISELSTSESSLNETNENNLDENNSNNNNAEKRLEKILTQDGKIYEINGKNIAGILYPNCLKEEIEKKIETWIDSIITAFIMNENIDYRIMKLKKYLKIVPIDYANTGVSQTNMVWHDALHQALQIINDIEIFPENINTNFLYMITFFKKYNQLYGLTGTIGTETNQNTLKELYKVKIFFIPPNLKSQLKKRSELVFTDVAKWEKKIINEIQEVIEENRSVLLICKSIREGSNFCKLINEKGIKIKKYFIEENKNSITEILEPKNIIIATNLAGRGIDIKLSNELLNSGGLHVIVSFLPINQRVEDQNYGRAGRNGQKGSYSLIFEMDKKVLIV